MKQQGHQGESLSDGGRREEADEHNGQQWISHESRLAIENLGYSTNPMAPEVHHQNQQTTSRLAHSTVGSVPTTVWSKVTARCKSDLVGRSGKPTLVIVVHGSSRYYILEGA